MTERLQLFFAVLALAALGAGVGGVVVVGARNRSALARRVFDAVAPVALWFGFAVTALSMGGSLYFSEIASYEPCTLCWYQRIGMYPLAAVFFVAAVRRDRRVGWYVWPLSVVGGSVSVYHVLLERFPAIDSGACSTAVPCTFVWFEAFGFITLAFMALCGFAAATTAALVAWAADRDERRDAGAVVGTVDGAGADAGAGG